MMRTRRIVGLGWGAVFLALVPLGASAQIETGDWRISAGIGGVAYGKLDVEGVDIETASALLGSSGGVLQVGCAATESLEMGLNIGVAHEDIEIDLANQNVDATSVFAGPYVALNLPANHTGSVVISPVFSAGYSGLFSEAIDINVFEAELGAELKFFVAKDASIDLGVFVGYGVGEAKVSGVRGNLDADGFTIGPRLKISIWP